MIAVVTSCGAKGWLEYGKRFVQTFCAHWPQDVSLHVVLSDLEWEAVLPAPWLTRAVVGWQLWRVHPGASAFDGRHRDSRRANGREEIPGQRGWNDKKRGVGYNFRYDAWRFAIKVFAIHHVARTLRGGRLFWIDADCVTHAAPPAGWAERLLPAHAALSCLDREPYHSECGFVGYNLEHPAALPFIEAFADCYASDAVFELPEWHDSWVFDAVRRREGIPTHPIPHRSRRNPFPNSELGAWMDHLKGPRKGFGRTPAHDILVPRPEPYWRAAR